MEDNCSQNDRCCQQLLAELGVSDPGSADLYSIITFLINTQVEEIPAVIESIPYPFHVKFVALSWSAPITPQSSSFLYTDLQLAINDSSDASSAAPYSILIYPGSYPGVTLAPYVNLVGVNRESVFIDSITYRPASTGEDRVEVTHVSVGDVVIDTTTKTSLVQSSSILKDVLIDSTLNVTLRTSPVMTGNDLMYIKNSQLDLTAYNVTVTTVAGLSRPAYVILDDNRLRIDAVTNLDGGEVVLLNRPAPRASRSPSYPTLALNHLFYVHVGGDRWITRDINISNANVLIHSTTIERFPLPNVSTPSIRTTNGTVINISNSVLDMVAASVDSDSVMSLPYTHFVSLRLLGTARGINRPLVQTATFAQLLGTYYGIRVTFSSFNPRYATDDYIVNINTAPATISAAPLIKVTAKSLANFEVYISPDPVVNGTLVDYSVLQNPVLLAYE